MSHQPSFPKQFDFSGREKPLYSLWEQSGAFQPCDDPRSGKTYCIPMPPPNANGNLHLGHASMLAYEDLMVRYHRMLGDAVLWIPGTDHAGIQTQVVFERHLKETEGKNRHELGRELFYDSCYKFSMANKKTITGQIRVMGASCDWSREKFTLDPDLLDTVNDAFVALYNDGHVYRGNRIVNWCPRCQTSLSDIEVEHEDVQTTLYTMKYGPLELSTVRPETKFGDTALAVHPEDTRYQEYIGKTLTVDSIGDAPVEVMVVADEAVDPDFGTGVIKVTPAHDPLDFEIGERHDLEVKQVIEKDGCLNEHAGRFAGRVARDARAEIIADLKERDLITAEEEYTSPLSVCERCKTAIEPLVSLQWWIRVEQLAKDAKAALDRGDTKVYPERFNNELSRWLDNLRDWNISRQIWWGPRLPIWYCDDCGEVHVANTVPEACSKCSSASFTQDPDTFDTWFSSGQWPYSILGGPGSEGAEQFYPTSVLETGADILFFWVARMMLLGVYRMGDVPFKDVYLHGLILDKDGKKMSKSKGNGIDPLPMIEKYGTDALRLSMLAGTTPGQNIRLYEEKIAQYRNFVTKLWNIGRFLDSREGNIDGDTVSLADCPPFSLADYWILDQLSSVIEQTTSALNQHQYGQAIDLLYHFIWDDVADWYVEASKVNYNASVFHAVFKTCLQLLHPFVPFVTEELWQTFGYGDALISSEWPEASALSSLQSPAHVQRFQMIRDTITEARRLRGLYGINAQQGLTLMLPSGCAQDLRKDLEGHAGILRHFANISELLEHSSAVHLPLHLGGQSFGLVLAELDLDQLRTDLEERIREHDGFIKSFEGKLANKQYCERAPKAIVKETREQLALNQKERAERAEALKQL